MSAESAFFQHGGRFNSAHMIRRPVRRLPDCEPPLGSFSALWLAASLPRRISASASPAKMHIEDASPESPVGRRVARRRHLGRAAAAKRRVASTTCASPIVQGCREGHLKSDHRQDPQPEFGHDDALGVEPEGTGGSALALENARLRAELARREELGDDGLGRCHHHLNRRSAGDHDEGGRAGRRGTRRRFLLHRPPRRFGLEAAYRWSRPAGSPVRTSPSARCPFRPFRLAGRVASGDRRLRGGDKVDPEPRRRWGLRALLRRRRRCAASSLAASSS